MAQPDPTWTITEDRFDPDAALANEGLFTLGSGELHTRGSLEEHLSIAPQNLDYLRDPLAGAGRPFRNALAHWGAFIPGIYCHNPTLNNEIVNLPFFLGLAPIVDGERLDALRSHLEGWRRELHLGSATLDRSLLWRTASGKRVGVRFERFISAARPHLSLQRLTLDSNMPADTVIQAGIDADVRTNGHDHFNATRLAPVGADGLECRLRTCAGDKVHVRMRLRSSPGAEPDFDCDLGARSGLITAELALAPGRPFTIEKRTAVTAGRGPARGPRGTPGAILDDAEPISYDDLHAEHCAVWRERWARSDVVVEGDDDSQLALRAAIFHLLRAHPGKDATVAIDAKGYAGEAYWGRFFWDTDIYLLPFYLYTDPPLARALSEFRVRTLPGARANAARYNYAGARYAWESDHRGVECCPNWQYRDLQIHVTADVAYALAHDAAATDDPKFLRDRAGPVILETARYWLSRLDTRAGDDCPHLLGVMGPDEFTLLSSDNAFTNRMVAFNLDLAARLGPHAGATADECAAFSRAAADLPIPRAPGSNGTDLVLQCEEYPHLAECPFDELWTDRTRSIAAQVGLERLFRSRALKQADVLLLMYLFPHEFTDAEVRCAWDEYVPVTTHDSSLSAGIHAAIATRLHLDDEALAFWHCGSRIDLDRRYGGAADGVHIAAAGAAWQAAVFGFAGVRTALQCRTLTLTPRLPAAWRRLAFPFVWKGHALRIELTHETIAITNRAAGPIAAEVCGRPLIIPPGQTRTLAYHPGPTDHTAAAPLTHSPSHST